DLRRMLGRGPSSPAAARLSRTEAAQPAAFVVGYALAQLWESWGVRPAALLGHSLGEYTAACVAGVFSLEDALELVALRAAAIQALPGGAMLAVSASSRAVEPWLGGGVALAAVNAPEQCVLSGTEEGVARAEQGLAAAGRATLRLAAGHAFHSPQMQPVAARVAALAARMRLAPPRTPMLSNVTGTWLTTADAVDPAYWARHLLAPVQFARGAAELLAEPGRVLVELGPGGSLGTFVRQQAAHGGTAAPAGVASLPHAADDTPEPRFVLASLGRLWTAGVQPDWSAVAGGEGRIVPLPLELSARVEMDVAASAEEDSPAGSRRRSSPDRDPLDGPGEQASAGGGRAMSEVERVLAGVWTELLGVAAGPDDDFFELGGHSLVATKLIARVRTGFGVEMRLRTLFQTRTVAALARWIENAAAVTATDTAVGPGVEAAGAS
ncbi:MAG: hypothetical protein JWM27_387, partial [Gemmatimonadetes bacterium]|nr:hypothetical protein [Gemmatimonadota bacterium]